VPPVGQLALQHLSVYFEADEKKKYWHQPIVDPEQHGLVDAEAIDPHGAVHAQQQVVELGQRRVGERKR